MLRRMFSSLRSLFKRRDKDASNMELGMIAKRMYRKFGKQFKRR